jgi:hypothetical protein
MTTSIIILVIGLVVFVPLIAIGWTLRHEPLRYLPPRGRKRRPRP